MGRWFLIIGIMIALLGSILAHVRRWYSHFVHAFSKKKKYIDPELPMEAEEEATPLEKQNKKRRKIASILLAKKRLRLFYAVCLGGVAPIIVFFLVKDPVEILSVAGTVAVVHTLVVVFLTLHLNRPVCQNPYGQGSFFL